MAPINPNQHQQFSDERRGSRYFVGSSNPSMQARYLYNGRGNVGSAEAGMNTQNANPFNGQHIDFALSHFNQFNNQAQRYSNSDIQSVDVESNPGVLVNSLPQAQLPNSSLQGIHNPAISPNVPSHTYPQPYSPSEPDFAAIENLSSTRQNANAENEVPLPVVHEYKTCGTWHCKLCNEHFCTPAEAKAHARKKHFCSHGRCRAGPFTSKEQLRTHQATHKHWWCTVSTCPRSKHGGGASFARRDNAKHHIRSVHVVDEAKPDNRGRFTVENIRLSPIAERA